MQVVHILDIDNFNVYPNPVTDNLKIRLSDRTEDFFNLRIITSLGTVVYSSRISSNQSIDASGIYLIELSKKRYRV